MSEHTKEPWRAANRQSDGIGDGFEVRAETGETITGWGSVTQTEANARRIVACVNACAGIPTELLEKRTDMGAAEVSRLMQLEQQRDKLLAALDQVARELGIDWLREEFDMARDVIAEVKGSK